MKAAGKVRVNSNVVVSESRYYLISSKHCEIVPVLEVWAQLCPRWPDLGPGRPQPSHSYLVLFESVYCNQLATKVIIF